MKSFFLILFVTLNLTRPLNFKEEQLKNSRVKEAYSDKENLVRSLLKENQIDSENIEIFLQGFKKEGKLELWAKNRNDKKFKLIKTYNICSPSGTLGPKRKEGDRQVPEGFYFIDQFNPNSNYYLSLKINYPNASDIILSDKDKPGGLIFIHGNCVTIGCIPVTDDKIKELYLFAVEAKNSGQNKIPVFIFPTKLNNEGMKYLQENYKDQQLLLFWQNLKIGFDYFEKEKNIPSFKVNSKGKYVFDEQIPIL